MADPEGLLKGHSPWRNLRRILDEVRDRGDVLDHVVLTGDLTHDGLPLSYELLNEAVAHWADRLWLLPGNHDERESLYLLASRFRQVEVPAVLQRVTFSFPAGHWRVIGLDTLVSGELFGCVGEEQLTWLAAELRRHSAGPVLIFLHHPPLEVGSQWLDRIGLVDRDELCRLIEGAPQVRLVCCGHIHQEFSGRIGAATVLAAPSTSVQFAPRTEVLVVDGFPPGARILRLGDDDFQTEVWRAAAHD